MTDTQVYELTLLDVLWDKEVPCEARHEYEDLLGRTSPMHLPCEGHGEWLYRSCGHRKVVCNGFKQETESSGTTCFCPDPRCITFTKI